MENLNTDQVLIWVLIIIALGAVAWAALQNWFFQQNNDNRNQFPRNFPPQGAYPPQYGGHQPQYGGDYPHLQTPRRSSPFLTFILIIFAAIGMYTWVSTIKPDGTDKKEKVMNPDDRRTNELGIVRMPGDSARQGAKTIDKTTEKDVDNYEAGESTRSDKPIAPPEDKPIASARVTVPETGFSIQVAALEDAAGFERLASDLRERFPKATIFRHISEIAPGVYGDKLLIGRFKTREAALTGIKKLKKKGYKSCFPVDFERIDMVEVY
ncbi:MAG: SPOR domain-containing protein [Saprospiraceae bacterium]